MQNYRMIWGAAAAAILALTGAMAGAQAQEAGATPVVAAQVLEAPEPGAVGSVTNRPLPRFASLRVSKANIRRGPGFSYAIDWVFTRRGMPLEIIGEYDLWRKVRDVDSEGGWIFHSFLRGARTAVVLAAPEAALRARPDAAADLVALAETGAILSLSECASDWCLVEGDGHEGWTLKENLWGAHADEVFD